MTPSSDDAARGEIEAALRAVPRLKFKATCADGCYLGNEQEAEIEEPDFPALARVVAEREQALQRQVEGLRAALEQIAKGEGTFSRDLLTHAENVIEEAKATARAALAPPASGGDAG